MFPAVISSKLKAAIANEEERQRKKIQAEQGKGQAEGEKKGTRLSEFEILLNEYSKIEADEIAVRAILGCNFQSWIRRRVAGIAHGGGI